MKKIKTFLMLILFVAISNVSFSQTPDSTKIKAADTSALDDNRTFTVVEQMPLIDGSDQGLISFIQRNTKYPAEARENCIQGKVFIRFIVDKKGNVDSVTVKRGVEKSLDDESVRVIKLSQGHWKPGTQNGKPVNVEFVIPISFNLVNAPCRDELYYYNEGVKYFKKDNLDKALENFKEAIRMDESFTDALYNAAVVSIKLKKITEACHYLNEMKKLGEKDADELLTKYCNQ